MSFDIALFNALYNAGHVTPLAQTITFFLAEYAEYIVIATVLILLVRVAAPAHEKLRTLTLILGSALPPDLWRWSLSARSMGACGRLRHWD